MQAIIDVVFPIFAIMLTGYLLGRFKVLGEASSDALNKFVYFVALPALFFISLARTPIVEVFYWPMLFAFGGGMAVTFLIALLIAWLAFPGSFGSKGMSGIAAIFSNTGYMGLPLLLLLYGDDGLLPGIITTVMTGVVAMALATAILEIDASGPRSIAVLAFRVVVGVFKSPLLLSALAGLMVAWTGTELPKAIQTFSDILGAAAGPSALFAIGLFVAGRSFHRGFVEAGWIVLLKVLVHPLVTWWLAFHVVTMPVVWAQAAVIQAALPTGALVFVLAQKYGVYVQRSTAVIVISTTVSVVTLSLTLYLLGHG